MTFFNGKITKLVRREGILLGTSDALNVQKPFICISPAVYAV